MYPTTEAGLSAVLDELTTNEPRADAHLPEPIDAVIGSDGLPGGAGAVDGTITLAGGAGGPGVIAGGAGELVPVVPAVDPVAAAGNAVELVLSAIGGACDGEWKPDDDGERQELVDALAKVLERRPVLLRACGAIPPELILAAVVHRYARKRVTRPSTAARLKVWALSRPRSLVARFFGPKSADDAGTRGHGDAETPGSNGHPRIEISDDPYGSGY